MAKKKKSEKDWSPAQQRSRRAARIRQKLKEGKAVSDDDQEWFAAYEADRAADRAPSAAEAHEAESSASVDDEPTSAAVSSVDEENVPENRPAGIGAEGVGEPEGVSPTVDLPPPPKAPPLPRPPRTERKRDDASGANDSKDWKKKYRDEHVGREATLKLVTDQYIGILAMLSEQIKLSGVDPVIDPEKLRGAVMLTADKLLPEKVEISPEMVVVGGTTALVVHRFMRRKEIAAALEKQQGRKDHQKWQEERARVKERNAEETSASPSPSASSSASSGAPSSPATSSPVASPSPVSPSSSPAETSATSVTDLVTERIKRERALANGAAPPAMGEDVIY